MYKQSKRLKDWKKFKGIVKRMKCNFFDTKINEIAKQEVWFMGAYELDQEEKTSCN